MYFDGCYFDPTYFTAAPCVTNVGHFRYFPEEPEEPELDDALIIALTL